MEATKSLKEVTRESQETHPHETELIDLMSGFHSMYPQQAGAPLPYSYGGQPPYGQQPYGQQPYGQQPYGRQPASMAPDSKRTDPAAAAPAAPVHADRAEFENTEDAECGCFVFKMPKPRYGG